MAGTLTIAGLASGLPSGSKVVGPVTMTGTAVIGTITDAALIVGDTTITVPTGAVACLIVLATSTATIKVRSNLNSGDSGLPIAPSGFMVVPIATGTTSLIINSTATASLEATFI